MADLLERRLPTLATIESLQTGRALREMRAQLVRLPEWLEYCAAAIRTLEGTLPPFPGPYLNYVSRVPLGVCGLLTPWNHPLLIALKKVAPALATGNSVVLKPPELAPVAVLELGRIAREVSCYLIAWWFWL
jgi:acyl-CoA reductase-like NAD-dependent aldehyde dehydrogenase